MNWLKQIGWMLVGGLVMWGMILLGACAGIVPGARIAFWITLAAIAAIYGAAVYDLIRSVRKMAVPVSRRRQQGIDVEECAVERAYRAVWLTWAAVLALELLSGFFYGMGYGAKGTGATGLMVVVGHWMLPALIRFGLVHPQSFPDGTELPREAFPMLYAAIEEAREKVGGARPVRVYLGGDNVGVRQAAKWDCVQVEPLFLKLLTREEFRQVMLHEYDHLTNPELAMERRWDALILRNEEACEELLMLGLLPLEEPAARLKQKVETHIALISEQLERHADQRILSDGCPRQAVAGIAKAAMYEKYKDEDLESSFNMGAGEEIRFNAVRERVMRRMMADMGETWRAEIERRWPAPLSSHPTFAQRKAALGVEEYDPFQTETDEGWIREMDALCAMEDRNLAKNEDFVRWATDVAKQRRQDIEAYERASCPLKELDPRALLDAALAYDGLNTPRALEILGAVCEREPNNGEALLHYGRILLRTRNDAGYDYLERAAEKPNYAGEALDILRDRVYESGDMDRIRAFEAREDALLQDAEDFHSALDQIRIRDLKPLTMPETRLSTLTREMETLAMGSLAAIDCAAKPTRGGEDAHVFVLEFDENVDEDRQEKVYQMIFELLDQRKENYALLTEDDISMSKLEARVPGCRVFTKE